MSAPADTIIKFKLVVEKRAAVVRDGDKLSTNIERFNKLPDEPTYFVEQTGSYKEISEAAVKLNEAQIRSGYLDYLYSPDLADAEPAKPTPPRAAKTAE
ncbi:hypothetical protein BKA24_001736 [Microbacterium marinum]|uniref:Uncharacterized protein n=1 Tax=Microbacterium marinum TaxID=421115 RepID=A0A7W7FIF7_9MICO|nr:hypothetical protein [Microbacterium marinum]MBB4667027.1 hypothetical protein [Microbacterium marinum]